METIILIKKPAAKIKYLNFFYKKKEKVFFAITYHNYYRIYKENGIFRLYCSFKSKQDL